MAVNLHRNPFYQQYSKWSLLTNAVCIVKRNLRGGFLTTTLGPCAVEDSGWLTGELLSPPKAAGCIQECLELSSHHTKPCWEAEDKSISLSKLIWGDDRSIALWWCTHFREHIFLERLRYLSRTNVSWMLQCTQ